MAKIKPAKGKTPSRAKDIKAALPCLLVVLTGIALLGLLFAAMLRTAR